MQLKPVTPTAKAPAANFTGDVYVNPIYRGEDPSRMIVSLGPQWVQLRKG